MPNLTKLVVAASLTFGIAGTTFGLITMTNHDTAQPASLPQAADRTALPAGSPTPQTEADPNSIELPPESAAAATPLQTITDTTPLTAVVHALDTAIQQRFEERAEARLQETQQSSEMADAWNAGRYQAWEAAQQQWWHARNDVTNLTRTITWLTAERKTTHIAWKAAGIGDAGRTLVTEDGDFWCARPNPVTDEWNETRQECDRQGATANLAYREWLTALSSERDHRLAAALQDPTDAMDSLVRKTFTDLARQAAEKRSTAGTEQAAAYGRWQNLNQQIAQYNNQRPTP